MRNTSSVPDAITTPMATENRREDCSLAFADQLRDLAEAQHVRAWIDAEPGLRRGSLRYTLRRMHLCPKSGGFQSTRDRARRLIVDRRRRESPRRGHLPLCR